MAERMRIDQSGNVGIGTTTPGSILSINGVANWTGATTTYYSTGGINLAGGCFAINGTCIGGGGSGTVNSGTQGQFAFYNAAGTTLTATSTLFLATSGDIGVGTTTPSFLFDVAGSAYTDTLTTGTENGTLVVGTSKYPTLAAAVNACPATGCSIYVASPQTIPAITITKSISIKFAPGEYSVTGTITFQNVSGIKFGGAGEGVGSGTGGTEFTWSGNSTSPMFALNAVELSNFDNFWIDANQFVPLETGIDIPQTSSGVSTSDSFDNIRINGTAGGIQYGFRLGDGSGGGQTDLMKFTHVEVDNYSVAAWSIEYSQSKLHTFIDCSVDSDGYGMYGVATALNGSNGGSFYWFGGGGASNTVADFFLGTPDDSIEINGGGFEGSARLLMTGGASASAWPITIENMRWSGDGVAQDGKMVIYTDRGPLNVIGNIFGDGTSTIPLQIYYATSAGNSSYANAYGNSIRTTLADPFTGNALWTSVGNEIGAVPTPLGNVFSGRVGIGTTTPYSPLEIWGPDVAASTTAFLVTDNASDTEFAIFDNGNATLAGNLIQNSDQRLKTNVQTIDASSSLAEINALNPVTFNWIDPAKNGVPQYGFIAQQVQSIFPNLVSTTSPTALTPDGTLSLNYVGLIAPIVKAIQAIENEIAALTTTVASFADSFTSKALTASNQLCVGSVCVTPAQFQVMVAAANQSASASPSSSTPNPPDSTSSPQAPVLSVNGNNPAIVQIGATYNDLGATITGPQADLNLGIHTFLNGALMSDIVLDTSTTATDTIDYVATDQNGLTSTSTRTVLIEPVASSTPQSLPISNSPPPVHTTDSATSTATSTSQ